MEQKFKRGNLARILVGHLIWDKVGDKVTSKDTKPEWVNKEVIIDYSYKDKYPSVFENDRDTYSVVFLEDDRRTAWFDAIHLEFVNEGGEHLFKQAKENRIQLEKENNEKWDKQMKEFKERKKQELENLQKKNQP